MCPVTYNVSTVLCLTIDMETVNTVNTLLIYWFHAYDDIELVRALLFIYSVRCTPHVHRGMAMYVYSSQQNNARLCIYTLSRFLKA